MAQRLRYQDTWTGKLYETDEEAQKNSQGPIQVVIQGVDMYPKKGFLGTRLPKKH
jgi:hypothetical protein